MLNGTFYGVGVGPGDPELITLKAFNLIKNTKNIFVPKADIDSESYAQQIVKQYLTVDQNIKPIVFPMKNDITTKIAYEETVIKIINLLESGEDVVFLTIGDPLFYYL